MIWEHFRRKEPSLNDHATSDLSQTPLRFRLTSPDRKWKRGGLAFGILVGKIKVFSNEQKSTETPSKHQRESFHRSFQSTRTIRDPPGGLRPISLNVNFGQICKRTRTAAAKTSGSFLTALKFLIVWFLGARWLRLPLQIPKLVSKSEIGPRGAKRRPSENPRFWQI